MSSSSEPGPSAGRLEELAANLARVKSRIAAACATAGRDAAEITLIAITKTHPAADVLLLHELGVTDFGENKDQEAAPKVAACAAASAGAARATAAPLRWHFVGQLQTNKAPSVARYADVVHSVDRVRLVRALGAAARKAGRDAGSGRELTCLVQVSLAAAAQAGDAGNAGNAQAGNAGNAQAGDTGNAGNAGNPPADPARGGAPPAQLASIAEAIEAEPGLVLGGVMAVAPLGVPAGAAFAPLLSCSHAVREIRPAATIVSAGMSGDLEAAIGNGATHVRIGTALLGARRPPVR